MNHDKLTARKIKDLLAAKHKEDIYIPECKMGRAGSRILDAWVLKKTWTPKTTIGYEIKVSRSDFLQDQKWPEYLNTCHQFYFVCPWKLIQKEELPDNVGLMWVSQNGTRIYTRRKASRRKEDVNNDLLFYILMNRVKITGSSFGYSQYKHNKRKYWELWLKNKQIDREFGQMVGRSIRQAVRDKIEEVDRENQLLRRENERLQSVERDFKKLEQAGLSRWDLTKIIREGPGQAVISNLTAMRHYISQLKIKIEDVDHSIENRIEEVNVKYKPEPEQNL
jgi:hypothetical protein